MELSKYQTLPGKLKSKKSEAMAELNGHRQRDGESLSPVQLSPVHSHDQDYTLSEFLLINRGHTNLFHYFACHTLER